ncbi:MAG: 2-keto-3-deoxygluconate kinase [Ponticaulis sp.]|mgnify:CR=1 FL=1|nr:2-keto-3-deoxygluconate kinase [Ponticaulis sp.]
MSADIACFGELLLRFTTPGNERLGQGNQFTVHFGGAEANVAVSLAQFGHSVDMVSAIADNPLGASIVSGLRAQGVGTDKIRAEDGRMGIYFLETGAVTRPSRIVYDRAASVFALSEPTSFDWSSLLGGVGLVHMSGITPATGPGPAAAAQALANYCADNDLDFSFDGNYREALWKVWAGDGPAILRDILSCATIAFINERDIALLLATPAEDRQTAINRAFAAFPRLQTIACTRRGQSSVINQTLLGEIYTRDGVTTSREYSLEGVVDRIGGGDAFAAGILHCLQAHKTHDYAVEFATAASVIKHSIPGDFNLTSVGEVEDAMKDGGLDVRR